MTIVIEKPLENIKDPLTGRHIKAVGIPEWRVEQETNKNGDLIIEIAYTYKSKSLVQGRRQFPSRYKISKSEVLKCVKRTLTMQGKETLCYIVPIEKLTEIGNGYKSVDGVRTIKCCYCGDPFARYTRDKEDNSDFCLKPSCVEMAKADKKIKDFRNREVV